MKLKKEITRFLIITPMVGLTDLGLYFLLKIFLPPHASKGISYLCGSIMGYFFNKNWTFRQLEKSNSESCRYWIGQIALLGYNTLANGIILHFRPGEFFLAVMAASLSTGVLSFISKKWWVFKAPCPAKRS